MTEEVYWILTPQKQSDWGRLSPEQRGLLENGRFRSVDEAAKARLNLQLALNVELQITNTNFRVA